MGLEFFFLSKAILLEVQGAQPKYIGSIQEKTPSSRNIALGTLKPTYSASQNIPHVKNI